MNYLKIKIDANIYDKHNVKVLNDWDCNSAMPSYIEA